MQISYGVLYSNISKNKNINSYFKSIIGLFVLTRETLSLGTGTEIVPTIFISYIIFEILSFELHCTRKIFLFQYDDIVYNRIHLLATK